MDGTKKAAYRLASITTPVVGEADPAAVFDTCRGCGEADHLDSSGFCASEECAALRLKKAQASDAGMMIAGVYYYNRDTLRQAPIAPLPETHQRTNAKLARRVEASTLSKVRINKLRRQGRMGEVIAAQREIEPFMTTDIKVPQCKHDDCTDCPRAGDTLCVRHRLEANALRHRLDPPRYRRQESATTELPSRKHKRRK